MNVGQMQSVGLKSEILQNIQHKDDKMQEWIKCKDNEISNALEMT